MNRAAKTRGIVTTAPLSEEETKEWNAVFDALAPRAILPSRGSPGQIALSHLASRFTTERAFDHVGPFQVPWLTADMRSALLREAQAVRKRAIPAEGMHLAYGGRLSLLLSHSQLLFDWAEQSIPVKLAGDARGGFIYYEGAGSYCPVHIDRPLAYEINLLICLRHIPGQGGSIASSFAVEPEGYKFYDIREGEGLLFHATNTLHGREQFAPGESATMFSLGFGAHRTVVTETEGGSDEDK